MFTKMNEDTKEVLNFFYIFMLKIKETKSIAT